MMELALTAPLLLAMTFGAGDFGRIFSYSVTLANAAAAGAFYGTADLSGVTATVSVYCQCSDGASVSCSSMCGGTRPALTCG